MQVVSPACLTTIPNDFNGIAKWKLIKLLVLFSPAHLNSIYSWLIYMFGFGVRWARLGDTVPPWYSCDGDNKINDLWARRRLSTTEILSYYEDNRSSWQLWWYALNNNILMFSANVIIGGEERRSCAPWLHQVMSWNAPVILLQETVYEKYTYRHMHVEINHRVVNIMENY